jgi:hypothetical protein
MREVELLRLSFAICGSDRLMPELRRWARIVKAGESLVYPFQNINGIEICLN